MSLDIDDLFDLFEMGRQSATVGLARLICGHAPGFVVGVLGLGQSRLDLLQGKLELIGIELL